jgi:alpha-L-fucosidase
MFKPTKKSIKTHTVPEWYEDAKLGIFIHWGLYSVPAFAVVHNKNFHEIQKEEGTRSHFYKNPYAEWYENSLRLEDTETNKYHKKEYGADFKYQDFVPKFNEEIIKWNPDDMAEIFKEAGARYVCLVTKHHDGFTMWPSQYPNPNYENYCASRDIVGELTDAVNKKDMRIALYYSSKIDWSWDKNSIKDVPTFLDNEPRQKEYPRYVENHWYELMEKYDPWILWSDIGYPAKSNKLKLFADFYNKKPEGLINNRWTQISPFGRWLIRRPLISKIISKIAEKYLTKNENTKESKEKLNPLYDFSTPEYQVEANIKKFKWETCRGLGNSFGYNKMEKEQDYMSSKELIHSLIDVVSKNGNLLINLGPKADGSIPEIQKKLILDLGSWLKINGEAIYGTRPWKIAEKMTNDGIPIRFTVKDSIIYAILLEKPRQSSIIIPNVKFPEIVEIILIGSEQEVKWGIVESTLVLELPLDIPESDAYAFKMIT